MSFCRHRKFDVSCTKNAMVELTKRSEFFYIIEFCDGLNVTLYLWEKSRLNRFIFVWNVFFVKRRTNNVVTSKLLFHDNIQLTTVLLA